MKQVKVVLTDILRQNNLFLYLTKLNRSGIEVLSQMSMLKKELVDQISDDLSIHKQDVAVAVDIILDSMTEALVR